MTLFGMGGRYAKEFCAEMMGSAYGSPIEAEFTMRGPYFLYAPLSKSRVSVCSGRSVVA